MAAVELADTRYERKGCRMKASRESRISRLTRI